MDFTLQDIPQGVIDTMCDSYREWNAKINVISRKDIDNVYSHHILHSLCIAEYLERKHPDIYSLWKKGGVKVLDAGCGGGFPGIPLAVIFPDVEFTLCDSVNKKLIVAANVAESLGLKNIHTVHSRLEELNGKWDWCVSRAVCTMELMLSLTEDKVRNGYLLLKGGDLNEEIASARASLKEKSADIELWPISEAIPDEACEGYYSEKLVVNLGFSQK